MHSDNPIILGLDSNVITFSDVSITMLRVVEDMDH